MAHVEDRWHKVEDGQRMRTERYGKGRRWRARWTDPDGYERSQSFDRRADADRQIASVEVDKLRGSYVDPRAGRVTLRRYAEDWLAMQTFDESTREIVEVRLRVHVFPFLGEYELAALLPSHVQAWLRGRQQSLALGYVRVIYENLAAVLTAAVDDGKIVRNPCRAKSVKVRRPEGRKVIPWSREHVQGVRAALPVRYRMVATFAAGCGLRQGEAFAVAVDDVDLESRTLHVRRQVKIVRSRLVFALPKGRKTRDVPLPEHVAEELERYLLRFDPVEVELPWQEPGGSLVSVRLVVVTRERAALNRTYFNSRLWKPALVAAGVPPSRENGMHALRHWFASVLLDGGESIKAVSEYLGHSDAGFTLRVYTHLMPSSETRMRRAVDRALGGTEEPADGPVTDQEPSA